jgi:NRAMP (natural resistance-associated macrophage protein)-like metal ion transporter
MVKVPRRVHEAALLKRLGPGLITGAADDDPSGIATYSQAGAKFGYGLLWTMLLTFPLMAAIQSVAARIGRVTGQGLAANIAESFPKPVMWVLVTLLFAANSINIGADLAAMGEAAEMVTKLPSHFYGLGFGVVSLLLQFFIAYHRYVRVLKWLTLVLFAYFAVVVLADVPWGLVLKRMIIPDFKVGPEAITLIVAVFGTTISPYLFFWQSSQEVEELDDEPDAEPLKDDPLEARPELERIRLDTLVGMGLSNLVAVAIMVAVAATLNAHGQTSIETAAQAAEALKPVAGQFAFALFAIGIIGTGLLAVPVLAGSTAFAVAECQNWKCGLEYEPWQAWGFYAVIALAMAVGVAIDFSPIDPIQALVWSAVINGVVAVPIMAVMMVLVMRKSVMGVFTATPVQAVLGWLATGIMAAAAVAMFVFR